MHSIMTNVCNISFYLLRGGGGRPLDEKVKAAVENIFFYIENNEDSQFTLTELRDVVREYVPKDDTILAKLMEQFGKKIVITKKPQAHTIGKPQAHTLA